MSRPNCTPRRATPIMLSHGHVKVVLSCQPVEWLIFELSEQSYGFNVVTCAKSYRCGTCRAPLAANFGAG